MKTKKPRVIWVAVNESSGIIYCHGDGSKTHTEDGWRNVQFREVIKRPRKKRKKEIVYNNSKVPFMNRLRAGRKAK